MITTITNSLPVTSGSVETLYDLLSKASGRHVRITCIGDSREDNQTNFGGRRSAWQINRRLRIDYGLQSELPTMPQRSEWGSASTVAQWGYQHLTPYGGATHTDNYQMPRFLNRLSGTVSAGATITVLDPTMQTRSGGLSYFNESSSVQFPFDASVTDLVADVIFRKSSAGPVTASAIYRPTTSNTPNAAAAGTEVFSVGDMDADDTTFVTLTTDALAYDPAKPYPQIACRFVDGGGTATANGRIMSMRWRRTGLNQGVSYTTLAVGGTQYEDWISAIQGSDSGGLSAFNNAFTCLESIGLPDATRFALGANDFTKDDATIESEVRQFIVLYRSFLKQPNHLILLEPPYPRVDTTDAQQQQVDRFAGIFKDIADDTSGVVFCNVPKVLLQRGVNLNSSAFSSDGIHLNEAGDFQKTEALCDIWATVPGITGRTESEILQFLRAGKKPES